MIGSGIDRAANLGVIHLQGWALSYTFESSLVATSQKHTIHRKTLIGSLPRLCVTLHLITLSHYHQFKSVRSTLAAGCSGYLKHKEG